MSVIECTNLTNSYGRSQILKDITFSIEENKITRLIGRNGGDKTHTYWHTNTLFARPL